MNFLANVIIKFSTAIVFLPLLSENAISQTNSFPLSGNVGIGTTTPQTGIRLDVRSDATINGSSAITGYGYNSNSGVAIRGYGYALSGNGVNYGVHGMSLGNRSSGTNVGGYFEASGALNNYALITGNGNVGVGANNPESKLMVAGNIKTTNGDATWDNLNIWSDGVSSFIQSNGDENGLKIKSNNANKIILESNVGIGTDNPTEKLSVNGNIRAKKLIVTQTGWPDYVFSNSYKLIPIKDIAIFISKKKHLPNMPSAIEVEENGLDVGNTQAALLKKIEELTLYIIEMNARINNQQKEIRNLKKAIKRK